MRTVFWNARRANGFYVKLSLHNSAVFWLERKDLRDLPYGEQQTVGVRTTTCEPCFSCTTVVNNDSRSGANSWQFSLWAAQRDDLPRGDGCVYFTLSEPRQRRRKLQRICARWKTWRSDPSSNPQGYGPRVSDDKDGALCFWQNGMPAHSGVCVEQAKRRDSSRSHALRGSGSRAPRHSDTA